MTQKEFAAQLKAVVPGRRVAYTVFKKPQNPPYALYALPNNDDFHADDERYFYAKNGWLELYMAEMDFVLTEGIEQIFITNGLPWEKENEGYSDGEKVFFARWIFQLF